MEPPPLARFVTRKSNGDPYRLRSMSGGSSSRYEPEVVEIKPPASKTVKFNQVVPDGVIEIDGDEDSDGILIIDENVNTGSTATVTNNGHGNFWQQVKDALPNDLTGPTSSADFELMDSVPLFPLNDLEPESHNLNDVDGYDSDSTYYDYGLTLQAQFDAMDLPPGVEATIPWMLHPAESQKIPDTMSSSTVHGQSSSSREMQVDRDEILKKFRLFKQFDTAQDHSDHHYDKESRAEPSKDWAKKIQEEWKILEMGLPDTIFVRVYEERMDLLRAVIVGAAGTPYHDGLFFFDVFFPFHYPNVPPKVYYYSGGLRLNPNLYKCGKVCLSLLNTWSGDMNQKWIPGKSTMLQVLVSIQALVLNATPYFNEPGYESSRGKPSGEKHSREYNEEAFILSCRTMLYSLNKPPKNFEDFVTGHFHLHADDILVACKAYMEGAQVGCLAKGGVQDVDQGDKSCSNNFKNKVADIFNLLVTKFTEIGIEDFVQFIPRKTETLMEEDLLDEF